MKIVVKRQGGRALRLLLPTNLLLNRFTAWVAPRFLRAEGISLTSGQLLHFIKTLRACKRRHRDWVLAEVKSADGEYVKIQL